MSMLERVRAKQNEVNTKKPIATGKLPVPPSEGSGARPAPIKTPKEEPLRPSGRSKRKTKRLPEGSRFQMTYDATAELWSGSLTIGELVFTCTDHALFPLCRKLDVLYRKYLWEQLDAKTKAQ